MTHKIQISKRLDDGVILVLGADNADEFNQIINDVVSREGAEHIVKMFRDFAETGEQTTRPVTETRARRIGER